MISVPPDNNDISRGMGYTGLSRGKINGKGDASIMTTLELPTKASVVLRHLKSARDLGDVYSILDLETEKDPEFVKINDLLYEYKGVQFQTGLQMHLDEYASNLSKVNVLGIQCAPTLVDYIKPNTAEGVVVLYAPDNTDGTPAPYKTAWEQVDANAKTRFLIDMETLTSNGFKHATAAESDTDWYVTKRGTIYLDQWNTLDTISTRDRDDYLASIRKELML